MIHFMEQYDHIKIEKKWQKVWEKKKPNKVKEDLNKKKFYALIEFPYPSGAGMHVGHIRSNTAMDIISRKRRREGYNVLYPIGWDAFGLPTENYAIKTGIQPAIVTKQNTDNFRKQLKMLGFSFDWDREIDTTDPKYYKWTQWIFLQFLKKGLAYKKKMTINWCPKDLIGLANEEVVDGCCDRCGTKVEQREKEQWMLAITKYAERLDKDLDETEFLEKIKIQQRNWIGKSEGAEISFEIQFEGGQKPGLIPAFTTRPDTIYGVTYIVLSPEHPWVTLAIDDNHKGVLNNADEVKKYVKQAKDKSTIERTDAKNTKTGVEVKGVWAINPATKEKIPVWVADYVLSDYGTGAVMAVPAHDERDWYFAKKYKLNVKYVLEPKFIDATDSIPKKDLPYIKREAVCVVVRNPKDDKYLCISWKIAKMNGLITGGIEEGEDPVVAARREVEEETGYKNLKYIRTSPVNINTFFFHRIKEVNRWAHFHYVFFDLENEDRSVVSEKERALHDITWKSKKELFDFLTVSEGKFLENIIFNPEYIYTGEGMLLDSGNFTGKDSESVKKEITEFVGGKWVTKFKLRDWIFSRQRYWGEPIPVVHCPKCGIVPVPEKELPLKLPKVKNYKPTETGESPLSSLDKWVNTKCPNCKGKAKRETDTMPNWAGSSWYYLRYVDAHNKKEFASQKNLKYWTPVDWYNGGMEHTTLHLLYSRFWHKFLYDLGLVPTKEPYKKRTSHGLILAEGGAKMSKSVGNVVNPDDIVKTVGADTLRIHEMFMGPFDQAIAWDTNTIAGSRRFIERIWKLQEKIGEGGGESIETSVHKTIKKVSEDIEEMRFNTAVSSIMILLNEFEKEKSISKEYYQIIIQLVAPFAPHFTEEIWERMKNKGSVHESEWPKFDPNRLVESNVTVFIQINGKTRGEVKVKRDTPDDELKNTALNMEEIQKWIDGKEVKKVIFVKNKLVNIVV